MAKGKSNKESPSLGESEESREKLGKERLRKFKLVRGEIVSDKMDKTRVLVMRSKKRHPFLKRSILRSRRIKIHDPKNESKLGDLVSALETRPLSRDKRHRLFKILEKAK